MCSRMFKGYVKIPSENEPEPKETASLEKGNAENPLTKCKRTAIYLSLFNIVLFAASIWLFSRSRLSTGPPVSERCPQTFSSNHYIPGRLSEAPSYSALLDIVDLDIETRVFNGRLRDNTSIYRMPPSPAVDEAWDFVSAEGLEVLTVPSSTILDASKDPYKSVRAPRSWDLETDDAYIVQIDVFHQIHCLNELRKEINRDYYYPGQEPDELHKAHKYHCIHMLLQNLMCHADLEIITHNWVHNEALPEPKTRPFPDFNVAKQCRNFDAILEWATNNAVTDLTRKWNDLRIPLGTPTVPGDGYA